MLRNTIYQLATHLDIQSKRRSAEGEQSEHLSWVINESLRLLPPAALGCSRAATLDHKCKDCAISAGSFTVPTAHTIHRPERYCSPEAEQFSNFHPCLWRWASRVSRKRACSARDDETAERPAVTLSVLV